MNSNPHTKYISNDRGERQKRAADDQNKIMGAVALVLSFSFWATSTMMKDDPETLERRAEHCTEQQKTARVTVKPPGVLRPIVCKP